MRLTDVSPTDLGSLDVKEYEVSVPRVIARKNPYTWSDSVGMLLRNETFYGVYGVRGEPIEDIPIWIAHMRGGFIWSGALRTIAEWNAIDFSRLIVYNTDRLIFNILLGGEKS